MAGAPSGATHVAVETTRGNVVEETRPSSLQVRLLGSVSVLDGTGGVVDLGSPKQRAVLAILALEVGRVVTRDHLIDLLWNTDPPASAVATVQAYVSNLRRVLEPDRAPRAPATVLVSEGAGYLLDLPREQVDAHLFESEVQTAMAVSGADPAGAARILQGALARWHGPALADFVYEPFASAHVHRLEELRMVATEARLEAEVTAGAGPEIVPELEALLALHPLRERLYGLLMTVLYRAGRQADALRVYRCCEARLAEELGISPGPDLRALEDAILTQDGSLDLRPTAPATPVEPAPSSGLVGRRDEVAVFDRALAEAASGRGSLLLVRGEAGVGKTALMEEMLTRARAADVPAALARCVEIGGAPPFWPWVQISRTLMSILGVDRLTESAGAHAAVLAPFFPELAPDPDRAHTSVALPPHRVAQGIVASMARLTVNQPLVMLIDDLYGADPDSISVLTLLAAELDTMGLVVVASHRDTQLPDDHPLTSALGQVMRFGTTRRLHLGPFSPAETSELVHRIADDASDDLIAAIHQRSDGNALFVTELARLVDDAGETDALPASVRDVVRQRLTGLTDATVQMLRVAAVCGRLWEVSVVAAVLGVAPFELAGPVEEAVAAGLITETSRADRRRFSHVLVVQALTHDLGALRRAELHRRVAAAAEARHGDDPERWAEIAHHATEAVTMDGPEPAIAALGRAGRHALASNAYESASDLLERRLHLSLTVSGAERRRRAEIEALLDLAVLWTWQHGYHSPDLRVASVRVLELIGTEATYSSEVLADVVLPALQGMVSTAIVGGRPDETAQVVARLDDLAARHDDPLTAFTADVNGLVLAVHQGDVAEAVRRSGRSEPLLGVLDPGESGTVMLPLGQQSLVVTHRAFSSWGYWLAGRIDEAWEHQRLLRVAAEGSRHVFTRSFATVQVCLVSAMAGDAPRALDGLRWGRSGMGDAEFGLNDVWLDLYEAWTEGVAGDPTAAGRVRSLTERLEEMEALVTITLYWSLAADLELRNGDFDLALDATTRGLAHTATHGERYWYPELERLTAAALRGMGDTDEAEAALWRGLDAATAMGSVSLLQRLERDRAQ